VLALAKLLSIAYLQVEECLSWPLMEEERQAYITNPNGEQNKAGKSASQT
jgi:hypothetical protein